MNETYIIGADGTRFVPETEAKRRRNRMIAIAGLILATPFLLAALAGIGMAIASGGELNTPVGAQIDAALDACKEVPEKFQGDCVGLYLRPAYTIDLEDGATSMTPAGPALVRECTLPDFSRAELADCLTQPIN